jgi:hypothetical protein
MPRSSRSQSSISASPPVRIDGRSLVDIEEQEQESPQHSLSPSTVRICRAALVGAQEKGEKPVQHFILRARHAGRAPSLRRRRKSGTGSIRACQPPLGSTHEPVSAQRSRDRSQLSISTSMSAVRAHAGAFVVVEDQRKKPVEHWVLRGSAVGIDHVSRKDGDEQCMQPFEHFSLRFFRIGRSGPSRSHGRIRAAGRKAS